MKIKSIFRAIAAVLLAVGLMLTFVACGGEAEPPKKTHNIDTHIVGSTDKTLHHNFVDGKCTMCAQTTVFRQEPMSKSPEILATKQANQGKVEYFWYKTRAYGVEEKQIGKEHEGDELWIYKRAYVYLPYGYDKTNTSKKYNVLYMMHGNKLNEGYWFAQGAYTANDTAYTSGYGTENMLDYMADKKLMEDTIFVAMTMYQYYAGTYSGDDAQPNYIGGDDKQGNMYSGYIDPENDLGYTTGIGEANEGTDTVYWKEWRNHLMPYVVDNYNTYAASASDEDLIAARNHVGFIGLSRGGSSVASVLTNCLPYISYFGYQSTATPNDAQIAHIKANQNKYPVNYMFISCGSSEDPDGNDTAMLKIKSELGWKEGSDIKNGDKIEFIQVNGTAHNYATWVTNLYNLMLVFFKA